VIDSLGVGHCSDLTIIAFSGGSRPGIWGGSQIGGRGCQKCLHMLKY